MTAASEPVVMQTDLEGEQEIRLRGSGDPNWLCNLQILWKQRRWLARGTGIAFAVSVAIALLIPNSYVSEARIMPPENGNSNSALLAALTGRSLEGELLGGLAAGLMGGHSSGALLVDLLHSSSVSGKLIDRFQLQTVYDKRYRVDAAKVLARRTSVTQDKKSGVITITVKDHDPRRARDMVQAYLDQLNVIVTRTSTSSAHQERVFIEKRLAAVRSDLDRAQQAMSDFSSAHSTVDLREQTRATVESEARLHGELIAAQAELQSIEEVYGDGNVRVRAARARVGSLNRELERMGGSTAHVRVSEDDTSSELTGESSAVSYLPLKQVPRLAVPYANLYREVRVQETVYDLLTQQYEIARIQEAKDVPAVNVIDEPGVPEKKDFPPRALLSLALTSMMFVLLAAVAVAKHYWLAIPAQDSRRDLAREIAQVASRAVLRRMRFLRRLA